MADTRYMSETTSTIGTHSHTISIEESDGYVTVTLYAFPVNPAPVEYTTGAQWSAELLKQRVPLDTHSMPAEDAWQWHEGQRFQSLALIDAATKLAKTLTPTAHIYFLGKGWKVWLY